MTRKLSMAVISLALLAPALGRAQDSASGQASGSADIEMGATQPSQVEMSAGSSQTSHNESPSSSSSHMRTSSSDPSPGRSDPDSARLALQLRLDALNMLNFAAPNLQGLDAPTIGRRLLVPLVAPGVRFLEERLFLGLGLGLSGASQDNGNNMKQSRSGWSLTPTVTYDIVRDQMAALHLVGMFNMARLG